MTVKNWKCPYCGHAQTVTDDRHSVRFLKLEVVPSIIGLVAVRIEGKVCANEECKNIVIDSSLHPVNNDRIYSQQIIREWRLLPEANVKPQPEFIPEQLRNDYYEACAIRDKSPKASATLARRCLQGMIRDFFGISKPTLNAEINELRVQAEEHRTREPIAFDVLDAIDHVRKIGNIGAHMERDINVIVDVDPEEAQVLIELIETLFDDWYVSRQQRKERFSKLKDIADSKENLKRQGKAVPPESPPPTE